MTTNQDKTIYVTENKQEFVPEERSNCRGVNQLGISNIFYVTRDPLRKDRKNYIGIYLGGPSSGLVDYFQELLPLKTEAEIKRENSVSNMINVAEIGAPWVKDICEALYDAGYIKPREITDLQLKNAAEFAKDRIALASTTSVLSFMKGARWAEKHIKGEA